MSQLEKLIKKLEDLKQELSKSLNLGSNKECIELSKNGQWSLKKEEQKVNLNNPYNEQPEAAAKKPKEKESLDLASPGHQFGDTEKAEKIPGTSTVTGIPMEQVKQAKIKNLQRQIDAGTYKPDASKIASAMINSKKK